MDTVDLLPKILLTQIMAIMITILMMMMMMMMKMNYKGFSNQNPITIYIKFLNVRNDFIVYSPIILSQYFPHKNRNSWSTSKSFFLAVYLRT